MFMFWDNIYSTAYVLMYSFIYGMAYVLTYCTVHGAYVLTSAHSHFKAERF